MLRRENPHLGCFVGHAIARNLEREWADLFRFQICRRVILPDDYAAVLHVREKFRQPFRDSVLRVVGANAEHDRVESLQVSGGDFGRVEYLHVVSDLLEALRDLVARAWDVTDPFTLLPNVGTDDLRLGGRHQDVDADVRISDALTRE